MDRSAPPRAEQPWEGRSGCVGYVAKMFPRISETFILEEILALRRGGVPVRIYSLLPPVRDARVHPEAAALLPEVVVLPAGDRHDLRAALADLRRCVHARPSGTVKLAMRTILRPDGRSLRRLVRAAALAVHMRRDRVAHLHAAWAHGPASVARIASRLTGIPWSMGAHAKDIHLSDPRSLAKKLAAARFTLACSAANRDLLAGLGPRSGRYEGELLLIHHGVDADYFAPDGTVAGASMSATAPPVILSVGRLVPKKGFDHLLYAAARLRDRGVRFQFEIVGDGPERGRLEELMEQLGLAGCVILRGMQVHEEVRESLRRATCFALACRVTENGDRDGIPNTLAEAMASGLPVVATRLPGVEEIVCDGENGLLVPPADPEALAAALEGLLSDRGRGRRLGERGRAFITREFNARAAGELRARRFARTLGIERVLYVSGDRGVPVRGHKGASVHVRSVVAAFEALGVEMRILTSRAGLSEGPAVAAPLVEARTDGPWRAGAQALARWTGGGPAHERALLRLLDNVWLHSAGRQLTSTWRPDMIYERYALTSFAGALLARFLRVPFVLEVNAPLVQEEAAFRGLALGSLARRAEGWLVRRADRLVVVSWALYAHALRLGARHERILVLPNGVDLARFGPGADGDGVRRRLGLGGRFVVGFCGSLRPWHGVHRLLEAAAQAAPEAPDLSVLVVGEGSERARLERQAEALGIAACVRFVGAVPHEAVPDHLAACDLLAAPYEPIEGFYFSPLKVAEYLATGRPLVVSAVGELARTLAGAPGVTLAPPSDVDCLSRILVQHARKSRQDGPAAVPVPLATRSDAPAPPHVATWSEVARRTLAAAEEERRRLWHWDADRVPATVCILEEFSCQSELPHLLELERRGARVVVFALEPPPGMPHPALERLRASVRILSGPGGPGALRLGVSHVRSLVRTPRAYLERLFSAARRGALARFAFAPWIAERARALGAARFIAAGDNVARTLPADAAALARLPLEAQDPATGGARATPRAA